MNCNGLVAHDGAVTTVRDKTSSIGGEAGEEASEDEDGVRLSVGN